MDRVNIAVLKVGAIGDLIQTTPFLRSLKQKYQDAHVTLFCGRVYAHVLKNNPNIDNIETINLSTIYDGNLINRTAETLHIIKRLRGYDKAYILQKNVVWRCLPYFAGIRDVSYPQHKGGHRSEDFTDLIGVPLTGNYDFFPDADSAFSFNRPYLVFADGGSAQRRWGRFNELADRVLAETEYDVVFIGDKNDGIRQHDRIINLTGKTSLSDCWHIINGAERFICTDCGLLHLASCTETLITALLGPTSAEHIKPLREGFTAVISSLKCAPCERYAKYKCSNNLCMQSIKPKDIMF